MSEVDCKTYSVFETHPRTTPKPSLTSRDHLHGRRGRAAARCLHALPGPCKVAAGDGRGLKPQTRCLADSVVKVTVVGKFVNS